MADPPKRKVATQITHSASTSTPSSSVSQPRARAKIDPSSIATPPTRPPLRSTPSSASLVSRVSATASSSARPFSPSFNSRSTPSTPAGTGPGGGTPNVRSPAIAGPSRARPDLPGARSTPVIRARTTPLPTAKPSTPTPSTMPKAPLIRPGMRATMSSGQTSVDRGRAKVKLGSSELLDTPTQSRARSRSPIPSSPLHSPLPPPPHSAPLRPSISQDRQSSSGNSEHLLTRVTSHHSSPGKKASALPAYLRPAQAQHPTASAPPSPPIGAPERPVPAHSHSARIPLARGLPISPNTQLNGFYANAPSSPELRTIGLPAMTPRRGSDASEAVTMSRYPSLGPGMGVGLGLDGAADDVRDARVGLEDRDEWSGSTAVEPSFGKVIDELEDTMAGMTVAQLAEDLMNDRAGVTGDHARAVEEEDQVEDDLFEEDAEEAKINRKVADLEISNASLMAINRSLEATKAKQRAEIIKLRRALRESRDGPSFHLTNTSKPIMSSGLLLSPTEEDLAGHLDGYVSDEMDDPELEERWEKIQETVLNMKRRGEGAVKRVMEEERVLTRVIDWTEMDGSGRVDREDTPDTGTPGRSSPVAL